MRERIARFLYGRYGMDHLGRFLTVVVLLFLVLGIFYPPCSTLALAALIYQNIRVFSRNIDQRVRENSAYLKVRGRVTGWFSTRKLRLEQRGEYRFYKCPGCRQTLRLPRGKGKLSVTCPKCRHQFLKKT